MRPPQCGRSSGTPLPLSSEREMRPSLRGSSEDSSRAGFPQLPGGLGNRQLPCSVCPKLSGTGQKQIRRRCGRKERAEPLPEPFRVPEWPRDPTAFIQANQKGDSFLPSLAGPGDRGPEPDNGTWGRLCCFPGADTPCPDQAGPGGDCGACRQPLRTSVRPLAPRSECQRACPAS
jgi:hypothetical protein